MPAASAGRAALLPVAAEPETSVAQRSAARATDAVAEESFAEVSECIA